jgi:hypothetical protein
MPLIFLSVLKLFFDTDFLNFFFFRFMELKLKVHKIFDIFTENMSFNNTLLSFLNKYGQWKQFNPEYDIFIGPKISSFGTPALFSVD